MGATFFIEKDDEIERLKKITYGVVNRMTRALRDLDFANARIRMLNDRLNLQEDVIRNVRVSNNIQIKALERNFMVAFTSTNNRVSDLENIIEKEQQ